MTPSKRIWGILLSFVLVTGAGCATLRELPRSEYGARPERSRARVETVEGLVYEFDYVNVADDTLTGYRERDVEGPVKEFSTLRLPLDGIRTLSVRETDWFRTGLVGGGALAVVVAAGLTAVHNRNSGDGNTSGGVKGVPGDP